MLSLWRSLDPRVRFFTRMHGFDLFAERSPDGWPPFRSYQLAHADRAFVASQAGVDYLLKQYPGHQEKFHLARLGTRDHGPAPWSSATVLRVMSCSNLVPLKRVDLLVEALQQVKSPVEWTHVGDGPERGQIERSITGLPSNVRATLLGSLPNTRLIEHYKQRSIDLFVHLSETEGGVPVALQEAASFGIPLLACDSGGVREIVDERTGVLLSHQASAAEIARQIDAHSTSTRNTSIFREGVRASWSERFRAEQAFGTFAEQLLRP